MLRVVSFLKISKIGNTFQDSAFCGKHICCNFVKNIMYDL